MSGQKSRIFVLFLVLVVAAGGMRFYRLGDWSFGLDELFTLLETRVFMGEQEVPEQYLRGGTVKPEDTQYDRLPRLIPAAHFVHWLGAQCFGDDEFGFRVPAALLGTLGIGIVFLSALPNFGLSGSLILALLLLFWPEHVFQSQNARFYSQSFLFVSMLLLLGGQVASKRSLAAAVALGPVSVLLVLTNTLGGLIWGMLLLALLTDAVLVTQRAPDAKQRAPGVTQRAPDATQRAPGVSPGSRRTLPLILILGLWSLLLLGIAAFHILPLVSGWNSQSDWGYPPLHAVMSLVRILGWPIAALGLFGILAACADFRRPGNVYWTVLALTAGLSVLLLPLKIVYNPHYNFLFAFPWIVVAGSGVDRIYRTLSDSDLPARRLLAPVWVLVIVLLNFPSLASYYLDGDRPDIRSAFRYVEKHWRDGDRLTGFTMGSAQRYIPNCGPGIPISTVGTAGQLGKILASGEDARLWIVLQSHRGGLDDELRRWLGRHAVFQARFGKKRFDYSENNVEIFLVEKKHNEPRPAVAE